MIDIFLPTRHGGHAPTKDYSDGFPPFDFMEVGLRLELILEGVAQATEVRTHRIDGLLDEREARRLHDTGYLDFLRRICDELEEGEEYIPSIFRDRLGRAPLRFRGGMYCKEIGTPLTRGSYEAALNSAQTALEAALALKEGVENPFALTRPPGHHAHPAQYGGYSFINNSVVALEALRREGIEAAVLDIDYHIGDGTAAFAARLGFGYFSIHIDPWRNYPYFDADVRFAPSVHLAHLPHRTTAEEYLARLEDLLEKLRRYPCDAVILSLGFDILASDYCQDESILLQNRHMRPIAERIRGMVDKPTLLLLEGGYDLPNLADAARNFTEGWMR